ncbi:MAG TPA: PilN domain-containing protein [Dokdonella sp.]|uniref:PilN domain-containing protein n=1 Tax=Dokdonella sp. TaxID=2291710 RepID=UPI002D7FFDE3|nr:PilN domain-containing protein [Dokdonella sp.]HET9032427.1 PilN domain-containing protein [Dokdonella sp.]
MKEALDRQLARLRMRLAKTPLPRFFSWWGSELLACLPQRWRKFFSGNSEALLLERCGDEILVLRERDSVISEFGRIAANASNEEQAAAFRTLRGRIENPALRQILCVPESRALTRVLTLPAAAENKLRQVLTFEMDRQTPFKADQVYFDSRVLARDPASRSLSVELTVLPRTMLDPQLESVAGGAVDFDAVDVRGEGIEGARRRVNLLPLERRARHRDMRVPINLGLAALAIILLVINMSESLSNRAIAVETMQAEVEKAAVAAREVLALKKTLQDSINGANFLSEKKRNGPLVVAMLDDLAYRLDDDTYLERFSIERNQIQLQGQSKNAAGLISVLSTSPFMSNPKLEGQIQPDPRTGKDRFTISAEPKSVPIDQLIVHKPRPEDTEKPEPGEKGADDGKQDDADNKDKETADGSP